MDYEIIVDTSFDIDEIKALISFSIANNENFFDKFYIEKAENEFVEKRAEEYLYPQFGGRENFYKISEENKSHNGRGYYKCRICHNEYVRNWWNEKKRLQLSS